MKNNNHMNSNWVVIPMQSALGDFYVDQFLSSRDSFKM